MNILWRVFLVVSLSLAGFYVGAVLGATFLVPKSAGLAGGAMVLGYAALGAVILAIVGLLVASRVQGKALRNTALSVGIPVLIWLVVLGLGALSDQAANREPDTAFAAAGEFTVTMERLDTSDPYLFVEMKIDSLERTWTQTGPAPDHKIYYAEMKSEHLIEIREALDKVAEMSAEDIADCQSGNEVPTKRLRWNLVDSQTSENGQVLVRQGVINLNEDCLRNYFVISRVLRLVEQASQKTGGRVKQR